MRAPSGSVVATQPRSPWPGAATTAGAIAAVLATGAIYALVSTPWISVPWVLGLFFFGPSAKRFDRRFAVNGSLALGMMPMALWVPPAFGPHTAVVVTVSLATGLIVGVALEHPDRLMPSVRPRDAVLLFAGALAALVAWPLRSPGSPSRALAMLSTGIDNGSHFAMFLEQRMATAGTAVLAANADGSGFAFDGYPQWFHKLLTVLAQIAFGDPANAATELVRYSQLQWLVFSLLVAAVIAAFLQALPEGVSLHLLVPGTAVLLSLLLGVPGAINLIQGHLSFLVAGCAPLLIFLLSVARPRPRVGILIVLAALVLVSASWTLVVPMAVAALAPPLYAVWRRQQRSTRRWSVGCLGLTATAGITLMLVNLPQGGTAALLRDGTVPHVRLPIMAALLVGTTGLIGFMRSRWRCIPLTPHLLLTFAASAGTLALGAYMWVAQGALTYYFWKLGLASLVVSCSVTAHAVLVAATPADTIRAPARIRVPARMRLVAAATALLMASAGLGSALKDFTAPSALWAMTLPQSLGARTTAPTSGDVDLPLDLARSLSPELAARTRLLATRARDMNPAQASLWFHALSGSATRRAVDLDDGVYKLADDRSNLRLGVQLARDTLSLDDGRVVVTDRGLYSAILRAVPPSDRTRVSLTS